jgi:hypothetical protein
VVRYGNERYWQVAMNVGRVAKERESSQVEDWWSSTGY